MAASVLISDTAEERYRAQLDAAASDMPRVVLRDGRVDGDLAHVEVAFFSGDCYPERAAEFVAAVVGSRNLAWLHSFSAGVDHPVFQALQARGVRITTSSGAAATAIAHTVALYLLALSRDLPGWINAQRARRWERHDTEDLTHKLLGVVGLGPIGREVARLGQALGMRVVGLRRTPDGGEPCETWPLARLSDLLPIADYLVLALPFTPATRHLLDAAALARLRPSARVINVGRGELIDEPALVAALADSRLAGAALDVFEREPLPRESPLWDMPHVIVTPHSAGTNQGTHDRAASIFFENLGRWIRGEPLENEAPRV